MKLMALDGNSIVNRAFYGVKALSNSQGVFTNAIFGFLSILQRLLDEENPDALCITFDLKGPTFRHKAFAPYKAQRKPMPQELAMQLPLLKQVLAAMNIPMFALEGWEADDLLGTISRRCEAEAWDCLLVTGDKDSLQLVTERTHVKLVVTRMGKTTTKEVTPELFREEYGFDPIHLIDLKALMGDSSDNYPGVPGIGEKTALALIQRWHSVAALYQNLEQAELKPAQRKKLEAGRDSALQCLDLATIRTDAPMEFSPGDCLLQEWNRPELYRLFLQLEFKKLIERYRLLPREQPCPKAPESRSEQLVELHNQDEARQALALWRGAEYVCLLPLPELEGLAVSVEQGDRVCLFTLHREAFQGDYRAVLQQLFGEEIKKVAHGVKELTHSLLQQGLPARGFVFDLALAAYLLDPTAGGYALDQLVLRYLGQQGQDKPAYLQRDVLPQSMLDSWLADLRWLGEIHRQLLPLLQEQGLYTLLTELELPLCRVLAEMELTGVLVDKAALQEYGQMLEQGIAQVQAEIFAYAGHEFNLNSPKQLGLVLFEELKLPPLKKTQRGYSTGAEILERLRNHHPIVGLILEYRQLAKLNSTYAEGLMKVIAPDGRIHTSFQNTVTATGRLSSVEPNLQNIPVRTPLGAQLRRMFICGPGNVLVDADYSQIELRLLAHIAQDSVMQEGFRSGMDIHTITASQVFGVPVELVTKSMRFSAKAVNFGIVYGISEFSLSQDIGVSRAQAKAYMERYFQHYAGVRRYMKEIVERAKADGYVTTLMGRRRPLPEIRSSNFNQRSFGERVALNAPIQGTAADIIKLAMIRVQQRLKDQGLQGRLVLQVHDELIVECPREEGPVVQALLQEEMESVLGLSVPLVAEAAIGSCWADAH